jgi:hypothetical protein
MDTFTLDRIPVRLRTDGLLLAATVLAACVAAPPPVRVEAAPGESVATRATFAWDESGISWPEPTPPAVDAELRALVRSAVVEELTKRGYAERADGAQFVVSFHATVRDLEEREFCMMRNRVLASDPTAEVNVCRETASRLDRTYRKGTLVVFVVDRTRGVLLWQGVAEDSARSVAEARTRIRSAVQRMFADFPERAS